MGVTKDESDSLGIINWLSSNLKTRGAVFVISSGILTVLYFLSQYIPLAWQAATSTILVLAASASGLLLIYSGADAVVARFLMETRRGKLNFRNAGNAKFQVTGNPVTRELSGTSDATAALPRASGFFCAWRYGHGWQI